MILLIPVSLLFLVYAGLFYSWYQKFRASTLFSSGSDHQETKVSIIIPARNEEQFIGRLLEALLHQDYNRNNIEIIVVDDHSNDNTAKVASSFTDVTLIRLDSNNINSYKKKAVDTGIQAASGELMIITDADCIPPPTWVSSVVACYRTRKPVFIAAPVRMKASGSVLSYFQAMDFSMMQGITIASVSSHSLSICNGANIAYTKDAFRQVNGFDGIDEIASGDDMLLMGKMKKVFPGKITYLYAKNAIVETEPAKNWSSFIQQRIRWASKAAKYKDPQMFTVLLLVYLFNLSFLALIIAGFFEPSFFLVTLLLWILKTVVELPLLYAINRFLSLSTKPVLYFALQPLHIFYVIFSGLLGQAGTYKWKGRRVK